MIAGLAHRGPGDRGVAALAGAVLGSARLHVQAPLAPSGPYAAAEGRVVAVVNGEIWNHEDVRRDLRALGHEVPDAPDTAVVAPAYAAWGRACFARVRGMFAIALHDAGDGATVLARDRFGIKPLYCAGGPPLRFASEATVLGRPGALDREALRDFLALGFVPAPRTLWTGVRKVRPGTALVVRGGVATETRFAAPPEAVSGAVDPEAILAALSRSVERHLGGDVPVGVLLSGGLDSAVLAALVAGPGPERRPLLTFSAAFPGEGRFDESAAARETARLLGARHVEVPVRAEDVADLLAAQRRAFGEPFADSSFLATLAVARRARDDVGAVLSGTGADELFAGYRRYRALSLPGVVGKFARAAGAALPASRRTRLGTLGAWARKAARSADGGPAARYLESLAVVPPPWRARLLGESRDPPVLDVFRACFAGAADPADGARAADFAVALPDDFLAKEDRAAMSVSIENRVPYLDDEVADLAGAVAARGHRASGGVRGAKASLRAAAAELLPPRVLDRGKRGFGVPISEWLRGPCREVVEGRLAPGGARVRDLLDGAAIDALVAAHRAGDDDLGPAVHALVVLEDVLDVAARAGPSPGGDA